MASRNIWLVGITTGVLCILLLGLAQREQPAQSLEAAAKPLPPSPFLLIDDFQQPPRSRAFGTAWQLLGDPIPVDQAAGNLDFALRDGAGCLHLSGPKRPQDAGLFIQARLPLTSKNDGPNPDAFDARRFDGIGLWVQGNRQRYAVRLLSGSGRLPQEFFQTEFDAGPTWGLIRLPFAAFRPVGSEKSLDLAALTGIAVAAAGRDAPADLWVDQITFYQERHTMTRPLNPEEKRVIEQKGTEPPFSGRFYRHNETGDYLCRRCGAVLFASSSKFEAHCGWPSFDDSVPGAVKRLPDADGIRTEIVCANCGGHLGHVFEGEGYTPKNTRFCVNSLSLDFRPPARQRAIFAAGCFWGVEHHLQRAEGVISTSVGYTGGRTKNPTYQEVCSDRTGHAEAVEVVFDPQKTSFERLARLFFEIHDFTQLDRQGPDVGTQYRSVIFYLDDEQKTVAERLIGILKQKGFTNIKTQLAPATTFYPAEEYHQDYYNKTGKAPYCHVYRKIFDDQ
ncbi:MAG: bifunctional methionine sulfoxide reductase B/A protein [Sedimentisphaerales bacterium]|nr:bifunctional methionine sulfoxide reductase B/A protein [Sedimentisphaerales bacterium]